MPDQLTRAWNLLKPEERPEGMLYLFVRTKTTELQRIAYDRLCQKVEDVLLRLGLVHEMLDGDHVWGEFPDVSSSKADRLTAACDALEAERWSE